MKWVLYTGKDVNKAVSSKGLAHDVVMDLTETKGYIIYTDNFYTSPQLGLDLLNNGLFLCGTLRSNRKHLPKDLSVKERSAERRDSKYFFRDNITVVKWHDNKEVLAMSTYFKDEQTTVRRRIGTVTEDIPCPEIISDYNHFMGGVDMADQCMCYYSNGRKSLKWWRKVVCRLHDQAITNTPVIHRHNNPSSKPLTNVALRLMLAKRLTEPIMNSRQGPGRQPSQKLGRLTGKHFPYISTNRRCVLCVHTKSLPLMVRVYVEPRQKLTALSAMYIYVWENVSNCTIQELLNLL